MGQKLVASAAYVHPRPHDPENHDEELRFHEEKWA